jgi:GWxTD domain-containing protein
MKNLFILLALLMPFSKAFAELPKFIQAQLFHSNFYSPADGPYVETYLMVIGSSIEWSKNENDKFQGKVEVTMIFKKEETIVAFDKYELKSPEIADTSNILVNFLDQQRFSLPSGSYEFEIRIRDMNGSTPPFAANQALDIEFDEDEIGISGIQLIESYMKNDQPNILTKSGYDLIPYVYNFIPQNVNVLSFYTEIYNTDKIFGQNEKFLLSYFIESFETGKQLEGFVTYKRENSQPVTVVFTNYNIAGLPSGNYNFVVEVRNRENELIKSNKLFFQRSNPNIQLDNSYFTQLSVENSFVSQITGRDTLLQYIKYLYPIATNIERNYMQYQIEDANADIQTMQRFFFNFWLERDMTDPEKSWRHYLAAVNLVNEQFGSPGKKGMQGYETDMGYIFLKYGPPNTITDRPFDASVSGMTIGQSGDETGDSGTVPYQIWHYYSLNNLRDRRFVFANVHLALFDYKLIHSNMPGEVQNENWQAELHYRFRHDLKMPDSDRYGGRSGDFYNFPR